MCECLHGVSDCQPTGHISCVNFFMASQTAGPQVTYHVLMSSWRLRLPARRSHIMCECLHGVSDCQPTGHISCVNFFMASQTAGPQVTYHVLMSSWRLRLPARRSHIMCECLHGVSDCQPAGHISYVNVFMASQTACPQVTYHVLMSSWRLRLPARRSHIMCECPHDVSDSSPQVTYHVLMSSWRLRLPARRSHIMCECLHGVSDCQPAGHISCVNVFMASQTASRQVTYHV